jgi:outer membrane biosynthesis protein TonB
VDDVVTEARRRLEAWAGVATTIPSPASVLCVRTTLDADPELTRDEWSLLALVDGSRSVAEIVTVAGRGEFAVVSALAQLVERGLLRISDTTDKHPLVAAQEMLSTLETGAAPAVVVEEVALEPAAEPMASGVDVIGDTEPVPAPEPVAETTPEPESEPEPAPVRAVPPLAAVPDAPDRSVVTPARAEPFLPRRQPDHPEEPVPAVAAAMGGAMAAPAAATYIERDPSVNKSLLLRLIAGVRGL